MKYRQIIPVDARQLPPLTPGWHEHGPLTFEEIADWCGGVTRTNQSGTYIVVPRLDGDPRAWASDWIVQDIVGHFHRFGREDFELGNEPLKEN